MRSNQFENPDTDLHILAEWLRNRKLEVDLHDHPMAQNLRKLKQLCPNQKFPYMESLSPHQLHIKGPFGCISVIRGGASFGDFEVYCIEGDLFEGVRRYRNVEHAGKTIYGLLTTEMFDESVPAVFCPVEYFFGHSDGEDGPVQEIIE